MSEQNSGIMDAVQNAGEQLLATQDLVSVLVDKLGGWLTGFIAMLPNLIVATLVVVMASIASRIARRVFAKAAESATNSKQISGLVGTMARIGVLAAGLFVALGLLELDKTVTSLIAGVGVVGLALGFAFQDIASNFMSGLILAIRKPFEIGDLVTTHDTMGTIERVNLRATLLRNFDGQIVIIPNKEVLQNSIINYTRSGERRIEFPVGVAYGTDLEMARDTALAALEKVEGRNTDRPVEAIYTAFGASSIDLSLRLWINVDSKQPDYLNARSQAIVSVKKNFDEAGIDIPFPIRTLDFGKVGEGEWARALAQNDDKAAA